MNRSESTQGPGVRRPFEQTGLRSGYNEEHSGHSVLQAGPPSLFPEWCLHRLLGFSCKKIWIALQRLLCTDTIAERGIQDTQVGTSSPDTDNLSEERLKRGRKDQVRNEDLRSSSTQSGSSQKNLQIFKPLFNFSQKPADCKSFTLWVFLFFFFFLPLFRYDSSHHSDTVSQDFHWEKNPNYVL